MANVFFGNCFSFHLNLNGQKKSNKVIIIAITIARLSFDLVTLHKNGLRVHNFRIQYTCIHTNNSSFFVSKQATVVLVQWGVLWMWQCDSTLFIRPSNLVLAFDSKLKNQILTRPPNCQLKSRKEEKHKYELFGFYIFYLLFDGRCHNGDASDICYAMNFHNILSTSF